MRKIAFLFILTSLSVFSQNDDSKFWDHVRFGGGFGFALGNNNTTLAIAPSAIYIFDDQFALGPSTSYLYNKNENLKSNVYGLGLISLYNPTEFLQLSAEFEQSFVTQKLGLDKYHFNFPALYLGIAYRNGWLAGGIRYDVLYDNSNNIYNSAFSPIVRFYF